MIHSNKTAELGQTDSKGKNRQSEERLWVGDNTDIGVDSRSWDRLTKVCLGISNKTIIILPPLRLLLPLMTNFYWMLCAGHHARCFI